MKAYNEADLTLFAKEKKSRYGRQLICKKCTAVLSQQYYQENREKIRKRTKKHQQENREKIRRTKRKYYQKNKEKINKRTQKHRQENIKRYREYERKYNLNHRKEQFEYRKKNREKRRMNEFLYDTSSGYLKGDSCCMWPDCYNINPFVLHNHHLWKKDDPNFMITLCANHHEYFTRSRSALLTFNLTEEEQLK